MLIAVIIGPIISFSVLGDNAHLLHTEEYHDMTVAFYQMMAAFIFLVFVVLFAIMYFVDYKPNTNAISKKIAEGSKEYKRVFSILPDSLIDRLLRALGRISMNRTIADEQIPFEFFMATNALTEIKKEGVTGRNISSNSNYEAIVSSFEQYVDALLQNNVKYMQKAESQGLGFGIITNNMADMALYSAMNIHEKRKAINHANFKVYSFIRTIVVGLKENIEKISE